MRDRECVLAKLERAKAGDQEARGEVAVHVYRRYLPRIKRLHSQDPAISLDDLASTFFEGIYAAIDGVDGRGDPLYHLGQRGVWAVLSEVRAIKAMVQTRAPRDAYAPLRDGADFNEDPIQQIPDASGDFRDVVISVTDARRSVRIIANAPLNSRTRQAFDAMRSGELGDPTGKGFNKKLAAYLGVSPQRASQILKDLRASAQRAGAVAGLVAMTAMQVAA